eukprot:scaffold4059_cov177-Amphora_coffeaeformis.AAC.8
MLVRQRCRSPDMGHAYDDIWIIWIFWSRITERKDKRSINNGVLLYFHSASIMLPQQQIPTREKILL